MGFNSGKFSGSTLRGTFKRLFSRKGKRAEKEGAGFENNQRNRATSENVRGLESSGYVKYKVSSGSDIFILESDAEPFIDHDEPRQMRREGRFLQKKPQEEFAVAEESFVGDYWSPAANQTVSTSSKDSDVVASYDSKDMIFEEEPLYESVPLYVEDNDPEEAVQMDVERLPAAPMSAEPVMSSSEEEVEAEAISESSEVGDRVYEYMLPEPITSRCKEIASPKVMLALPPYREYSVFMEPPHVILLNEAKLVASDGYGSVQNQEVFEEMHTSSLPSIPVIEEFDPVDNGSYSGYDVTSVDAEAQVSDTSSSIEEKLVDYADYVGYDFLPEVTEPVRREPRESEVSISGILEHVEIGDIVSGMMMLTVPELASDAFEAIDACVTVSREIPDDGMEELCIAMDDARNAAVVETEAEQEAEEELAIYFEVGNDDILTEVDDILSATPSTGYERQSDAEVFSETMEIHAVSEDSSLSAESEICAATDGLRTDVEGPSSEEEEIIKVRPKISFTFGRNREVRSFY